MPPTEAGLEFNSSDCIFQIRNAGLLDRDAQQRPVFPVSVVSEIDVPTLNGNVAGIPQLWRIGGGLAKVFEFTGAEIRQLQECHSTVDDQLVLAVGLPAIDRERCESHVAARVLAQSFVVRIRLPDFPQRHRHTSRFRFGEVRGVRRQEFDSERRSDFDFDRPQIECRTGSEVQISTDGAMTGNLDVQPMR